MKTLQVKSKRCPCNFLVGRLGASVQGELLGERGLGLPAFGVKGPESTVTQKLVGGPLEL